MFDLFLFADCWLIISIFGSIGGMTIQDIQYLRIRFLAQISLFTVLSIRIIGELFTYFNINTIKYCIY